MLIELTQIYGLIGTKTCIDIQTHTDEKVPDGLRHYSTGMMIPEMRGELFIDPLVGEYPAIYLDNVGLTGIWHIRGSTKRVENSESAYAARDKEFMGVIDSGWPDTKDLVVQIGWGRTLKRGIKELYPEGRKRVALTSSQAMTRSLRFPPRTGRT